MQSPKIIEGEPFDWEQGNRHMDNVVDDDGNVSMYHARRQKTCRPPLQGNAENSARRGHETD